MRPSPLGEEEQEKPVAAPVRRQRGQAITPNYTGVGHSRPLQPAPRTPTWGPDCTSSDNLLIGKEGPRMR